MREPSNSMARFRQAIISIRKIIMDLNVARSYGVSKTKSDEIKLIINKLIDQLSVLEAVEREVEHEID